MFSIVPKRKYDIELNVAISEIYDLRNIIHELNKEFGEYIVSHNSMILDDVLKLDYVPF